MSERVLTRKEATEQKQLKLNEMSPMEGIKCNELIKSFNRLVMDQTYNDEEGGIHLRVDTRDYSPGAIECLCANAAKSGYKKMRTDRQTDIRFLTFL